MLSAEAPSTGAGRGGTGAEEEQQGEEERRRTWRRRDEGRTGEEPSVGSSPDAAERPGRDQRPVPFLWPWKPGWSRPGSEREVRRWSP